MRGGDAPLGGGGGRGGHRAAQEGERPLHGVPACIRVEGRVVVPAITKIIRIFAHRSLLDVRVCAERGIY